MKLEKMKPKTKLNEVEKEAKQEIGAQLEKIKAFEKKFKDQWAFEGDAGYYFSVCFKSKKERDIFCKKYNIKLRCDDHIFVEEIKHILKE